MACPNPACPLAAQQPPAPVGGGRWPLLLPPELGTRRLLCVDVGLSAYRDRSAHVGRRKQHSKHVTCAAIFRRQHMKPPSPLPDPPTDPRLTYPTHLTPHAYLHAQPSPASSPPRRRRRSWHERELQRSTGVVSATRPSSARRVTGRQPCGVRAWAGRRRCQAGFLLFPPCARSSVRAPCPLAHCTPLALRAPAWCVRKAPACMCVCSRS